MQALDPVAAVAAAHEGRRTAEVLLGFSRQLLTAEGTAAVTRLTAEAAQSIGGCDGATVWLWNDGARAFTLAGHTGWGADEVRRMRSLVIRPDDQPELSTWPERPLRPALYDVKTAAPHLRHLIEAFGCEALMVVPMAAPGQLHGLVIAAWLRDGTPAPQAAAPPFARLAGIADQATTALQRATLLDQARMQAFRDELTGLANRRHLGLLLRETLQRVTATETAGLLFLDLDDFKHVNDSLGHGAGDLLLQRVARRLQGCVRSDDVVARLGGDEFTVLLAAGRGSEELPVVGGRILQAFTEPIEIAGRPVTVRPSIGGVVVTADHADPTELLREADIAMYTAKRAGGARMVVHDGAHGGDLTRLALAAELRHAIAGGRLSVVYQAQVDLLSGAVVGAEALVRWDHPAHGTLAPADFLPLAEQTDLIVALDLQVLRRAANEAMRWRRAGWALRVAVNVSARTLADERLLPTVLAVRDETGLAPEALEVELTGSSALTDPDRVAPAIAALRDHGVALALDGPAVGHHATRLHQLPVRRLKIDRSLVADLPSAGVGAHPVDALIGLGARLGIDVIAEGVETAEQAEALRAAGCHEAQGFLYGRPAAASELPSAGRVRTTA